MFTQRDGFCTINKSIWEQEKSLFNCPSSINVYHCIQNERNRSGEICIQPVWVQPSYCPEYNTGANTLDTIPCIVSTGCPDVLFLSNEVYKYPVCLNKTYSDNGNFSKKIIPLPYWMILAIGVSTLILFIVAAWFGIRCIRRKKSKQENGEESNRLLSEIEEQFYETAAFHEGAKFIADEGGKLLCLVGKWGSGKTSTAKMVYTEVSQTPPIIIRDILQFKVGDQPVILDEAINKGISEIEKNLLKEKIQQLYENMSHSPIKSFIILTLDKDMESVYDYVNSLVSSENEIKFIDVSKSLTKGDRTQILSLQFRTLHPEKDFSKVEQLALKGKNHSLGYPEICALFCRCNFQNVGPAVFCYSPLHYLKCYLQKMHDSKDNSKFLMLVYMSLNEMMIDLTESNDMLSELLHIKKRNSITRTLEPNNPSGAEIQECADIEMHESEPIRYDMDREFLDSLLPREFVVKEAKGTIYRLQHYVIKRMTLIVFGTYNFEKLLQISKREDLQGWIEESGFFSVSNPLNDIQPVLKIKGDLWKQYQSKMG